MVLNTESKYPNRRAYVLKLRGDAQPDAPAGRLENLVTGQQLEFASALELLEAISRELHAATATQRVHEPGTDDDHKGDRSATGS